MTRLHTLSKSCKFFPSNVYPSNYEKKLLREPELTLDSLLEIAQIIEAVDPQAKAYQSTGNPRLTINSHEELYCITHQQQNQHKESDKRS